MHVIVVISGRKATKSESQQDTALKINIEAAVEIARQIRLRDLGGIIVVDFIDLKSAKARKELMDKLHEAMRSDKTRHNILPMSKFGLVQITRERVRPETDITTSEICPSCNGTGTIESTLILADTIEDKLTYLWRNQNFKKLTVKVNPIMEAYLTKGFINSIRMKWYRKHKHWVGISSDSNLPITGFEILNSVGEVIE
jgi:ribonuclease G